ncbi:membrane lipoprotein lipid attachment site-containing protein [Vibrio ruber]|uniref:membrane lipoprotein lipid attachment site-containing protein n=1 Tax=Vibrio ruber TaxID=184755 RepID=UPI002892E864|nr:membrane lipoprotein lipid attachment site-containing protein [Vibrio ruber]WNJ94874.1 membrane lipoprotein lipid attachment site-containing protein [Vibrio ruber]
MKKFLWLILATFILTGCAATSSQNRYITVQDNVVSADPYNTRIVLSDGFVLMHQEDSSEFQKFSNTFDQGNIITKKMVFDKDNIEVQVIDQTTVDVNSYWTPRSHLMGDKYKKSTFYHAGNKYYIQQFEQDGYKIEGYTTAVGRYQLQVYVIYPEDRDVNIDDVLTLTAM